MTKAITMSFLALVLVLHIVFETPCSSALKLYMAGTTGTTVTPGKTTPREFRNLKPLPCSGEYKLDADEIYSSFFLCPTKLTVEERKDGKMIARGLVPVPVLDQFESALVSAMKSTTEGQSKALTRSWSGQLITDRNGGLYDSLTKVFIWSSKPYARKDIYESLRLRNSCASIYHGLITAIRKFANLEIKGLLVELADSPDPTTVSLGAAILVCRKEHASKWKLTATDTKAITESRGSDEAQLVKCTMDELFGIALVSELPVVISKSLFESVSMAGLLEKTEQKIRVSAPYFSSKREQVAWEMDQTRQAEREAAVKKSPKKVLSINEIRDATSFLVLRTSEKRAILRASGLTDLPRPREGPRAVDAMMIPLLDEEVAYEVLRRLAETKGNYQEAAAMEDFESKKPILARQINEAYNRGDIDTAKNLIDELNSLSTLRFDPTDPNGVVGPGFDVEEWYWEQRKRVMVQYGV